MNRIVIDNEVKNLIIFRFSNPFKRTLQLLSISRSSLPFIILWTHQRSKNRN